MNQKQEKIHWTRMFKFAHFSYNEEHDSIMLRVTTFDEVEELYFWNNKKSRKEAQKYFCDDTHVLIDPSITEEMRRVCEER